MNGDVRAPEKPITHVLAAFWFSWMWRKMVVVTNCIHYLLLIFCRIIFSLEDRHEYFIVLGKEDFMEHCDFQMLYQWEKNKWGTD